MLGEILRDLREVKSNQAEVEATPANTAAHEKLFTSLRKGIKYPDKCDHGNQVSQDTWKTFYSVRNWFWRRLGPRIPTGYGLCPFELFKTELAEANLLRLKLLKKTGA